MLDSTCSTKGFISITSAHQTTLPYWAEMFLDKWCTKTIRSKIEPMKRVARMLRNHHHLLLNWFWAEGRFSSGVVEGFNNKAKLTTGKAYGFRIYHGIEIALYHALGDLPVPKTTHEFFEEAHFLHFSPFIFPVPLHLSKFLCIFFLGRLGFSLVDCPFSFSFAFLSWRENLFIDSGNMLFYSLFALSGITELDILFISSMR